jgi:predicted lactoylglutathione lyase
VVQEPTQMDFGFTFVVEDLDGHRLRPCVLAEQPR